MKTFRKGMTMFAVIILTPIMIIYGLYLMNERAKKELGLNGDLFMKIAHSYFNKDFDGVVTKKFIDWDNHGFRKIVLVNQTETREVRL